MGYGKELVVLRKSLDLKHSFRGGERMSLVSVSVSLFHGLTGKHRRFGKPVPLHL